MGQVSVLFLDNPNWKLGVFLQMARNRIRQWTALESNRALDKCQHGWPLVSHTATVVASVNKHDVVLDYHQDCIVCGPYARRMVESKEAGVKYRRGRVLETPGP